MIVCIRIEVCEDNIKVSFFVVGDLEFGVVEFVVVIIIISVCV